MFEVLSELGLDAGRLAQLRARAFELARERLTEPRGRETLDWLEELNKLFVRLEAPHVGAPSRAYFSPGDACLSAVIATLLNGSYNWTRSAAYNEENVIVTSEPKLVQTFAEHFARMWAALGH